METAKGCAAKARRKRTNHEIHRHQRHCMCWANFHALVHMLQSPEFCKRMYLFSASSWDANFVKKKALSLTFKIYELSKSSLRQTVLSSFTNRLDDNNQQRELWWRWVVVVRKSGDEGSENRSTCKTYVELLLREAHGLESEGLWEGQNVSKFSQWCQTSPINLYNHEYLIWYERHPCTHNRNSNLKKLPFLQDINIHHSSRHSSTFTLHMVSPSTENESKSKFGKKE